MKLKTILFSAALLLLVCGSKAQTTHNITLTLNQPAQLNASAGSDVLAYSGQVVTVGGTPAVTGGIPPYTYAWSPADGLSNPALANPDLTVGNTTSYTLTITDSLGCTASSAITVGLLTGIDNAGSEIVKIYPNPASKFITVELKKQGLTLFIMDAKGAVVQQVNNTALRQVIDVSSLSPGNYFISLNNPDQQAAKIVIR